MHARSTVLRAALVAPLTIVAVACSGGGDDVADPTAETFETVRSTEPLFTRTSDRDGDATSATTEVADEPVDTTPTDDVSAASSPAPTDPATSPPTVPDTGVPGIDSEDEFCRAWSEFAGSFQALAGAWALGDPTEAARSEVAAADVVRDAATALDAQLPTELEPERGAVGTLVEPLSRRAEAARDELVSAAVTDDGIEALGAAWVEALTAFGVDDPAIAVIVPPEVDEAAFGAAAASFGAAKPSLIEDPSLIVDIEIPLTEQYLMANCPDQGTLGGNDNIGS
jgi:hypothetical protein